MDDKRAVIPLLRRLKDPRWYVRQHAAETLGALGDPRAFGALKASLRDPRPAVSKAAQQALTRLKDTTLHARRPRD